MLRYALHDSLFLIPNRTRDYLKILLCPNTYLLCSCSRFSP